MHPITGAARNPMKQAALRGFRFLGLILATLCLASALACGGGGSSSNPAPSDPGGTAPTAPSITAQPQGKSVSVGQTATFTVGATGTAPLSYQWKKNGTAIDSNATAASYTTPATTLQDDGSTFSVTVTNGIGHVDSNSATLHVTNGGTPSATITEQILVDQFGWRTTSLKIALMADPQEGQNSANHYTPGATFEVRDASSGAVVFTGSPAAWNGGQTDSISGDKVWTADFTALTTPGRYVIYDPDHQLESYPFTIGDDVYREVLRHAVRMFYYQRCGMDLDAAHGGNWVHTACHTQDKTALRYENNAPVSGTTRDVSGGWHDAGDYNKYVPFTSSTLGDLLMAYDMNPAAFTDDTGIPESGNGVPDILDEIAYELDWLLRMQEADGSVHNRVAVLFYNSGDTPQADTQARYYTPVTSWATSTAAAAFAHASRIFAGISGKAAYANTLKAAAINAWGWLNSHPDMTPADGTDSNAGGMAAADGGCVVNTDRRLRLLLAAEIYATTGVATYDTYFTARYKDNASNNDDGPYPFDASGNVNFIQPDRAREVARALAIYAQNAASPVAAEARQAAQNFDDWILIAEYDNQSDPYRGYLWPGQYTWGSNQTKANWGSIGLWAQWMGAGGTDSAKLSEIAEEYLHYFHGRNPLGYVYLTNMGPKGADLGASKSVMEAYHGWFHDGSALYDGVSSQFGQAPGYLAGGPNAYFDVSWIAPPCGEPPMKAFLDWNTGWNDSHGANENSWEITEPGIYYQAAYIVLLSKFAQ